MCKERTRTQSNICRYMNQFKQIISLLIILKGGSTAMASTANLVLGELKLACEISILIDSSI